MQRRSVSFRLRPELDADLIDGVREMDVGKLSDMARDGLRLMLGIRTTRQVEVRERPLILPEQKEKIAAITAAIQSKPVVFRPTKNR